MPREDDYRRAYEIAKEELRNRNPHHVCRASGALSIEENKELIGIRLMFLNRFITIDWPDIALHQESQHEIPIKEQILVLHYLNGVGTKDLTGEWITYKDIPSARFYLDAFNRRVINPLVGTFGESPDQLPPIAKELFEATNGSIGDVSLQIQAFPKMPIMLVIWKGDEEFPPNGTILFDRLIDDIFSAEDVTEIASHIVYPLIKKAA